MNQPFERDRQPWSQGEGSREDVGTREGAGEGASEAAQGPTAGKPGSRVNVRRVVEAGRRLGEGMTSHARRRPQMAIGVALAVGFVAGSIFGNRLGQVMVAGAAGYLIKHALLSDPALEEIQRVLERLSRTADDEHTEAEA